MAFLLAAATAQSQSPEAPKNSAPGKAAIASAEKTSFNEVTAELDPGGSIYLYLNTSQWLENLSTRIESWREAILSSPGVQQTNDIASGIELLRRLVKTSGIEAVRGVGLSGIALEKGFYQTKLVVHRDPNAPPGGVWTAFGQNPHPLTALDWLPASTAIAGFVDCNLAGLWRVLVQEIDASGFVKAKAFVEQLNTTAEKATGKKVDALLNSLGSHCGALLALDDSQPIHLPFGRAGVDIPEPGIVIVLQVNDDTIFNWIERTLQNNPQVIRTDEGDLRMRIVPLPIPAPMPIRITIARQGGYLFIASNDTPLKNVLAAKAGQSPALKDTAEFKRLADGMPADGNSFSFVSERFGSAVQRVQTAVLTQAQGNTNQAPVPLLQKIYSLNTPRSSFMISRSTPFGWVTVGHGTQEPAAAIALPLVIAPVAIVAGMTLPALSNAKNKSQQIMCSNNLRQLGLGARLYATDHDGAFPADVLSMTNELSSPLVLICPMDPKRPQATRLTWKQFDPAQSSYEYFGKGMKEPAPSEKPKVLFRCQFHGLECLSDGSVPIRRP